MAIRTEYTTFYAEQKDEMGNPVQGVPATDGFKPVRCSDCDISGNTEEITSDVVLPESRIQAMGDAGKTSCEGNLSTEFYADEIDDFLKASILAKDWQAVESDKDGYTAKKISMGYGSEANKAVQRFFTFVKKYHQGEKTFERFEDVTIGQMQLAFELNSKVKATFSLMGSNNPTEDVVDPMDSVGEMLKTKSYNTRKGSILVADTVEGLIPSAENKQVRSIALSVNQNPESTDGMFQTKAIDSSLGNEVITGNLDIWNTQDRYTREIFNKAKEWAEKYIRITLDRDESTIYQIDIHATLKTPERSKDGNKLSVNVPFQVYDEQNGVVITKYIKD